jgi:ferredoxin-NADP reductase/Na+-translocating ferredoxin:NAD+ oxidoreductase RnfD subunit
MYRLVLYSLIGLLCVSVLGSLVGQIPYTGLSILFSSLFLVAMCWAANTLFSYAFDAPTNIESVYITALILALIISPAQTSHDFIFLGWASILAMGSKFILAIGKKHIFNPAAVAVLITMWVLGQSASWWVGTALLAPFVLLVGAMIIRKLHYEDLAWGFFTTFITVSLGITVLKGGNVFMTLQQVILHSSLLFMGGVMVTEPITMPPTKKLQTLFGFIIGLLAVPQINIGGVYFAPELAICVGNICAYIVSPKVKLILTLKEKIQISSDSMDFVFAPGKKFDYIPGQYMEWTIPHEHSDDRGNRRYFTLASSPTEDSVRLGVKFYQNGSSYKQALMHLDTKTPVVGAQLAGDFVLPKDAQKKLVFVAGGIGITPYRSMLKYLIDTNQKRDIVVLYSNKDIREIAYMDVLDEAQAQLGIRTIYTLTDTQSIPQSWTGKAGRINEEMIQQEIPDFKDRTFYISGPHAMVAGTDELLKKMKIPNGQIKKDFFPGL